MNIVFISEYAARELYVVEQVMKKYPAAVVVKPSHHSASGKKKKLSGKYNPGWWVNRAGWKMHHKLWDYKFYGMKKPPRFGNIVAVPSSQLNKTTGINVLQRLSPDILITCRAPLLKQEVYNIPSIAAINIHYGIPPHYRGNDTLFWALYYNDFDCVGGCIHHITDGIDTGNILAEVYPALHPEDGEIAVDYKTSQLLAEALLTFLEAAENKTTNLKGKPQNEKGRNFNNRDRTLKKSAAQLLRKAMGLAKLPERDEKIVTYWD